MWCWGTRFIGEPAVPGERLNSRSFPTKTVPWFCDSLSQASLNELCLRSKLPGCELAPGWVPPCVTCCTALRRYRGAGGVMAFELAWADVTPAWLWEKAEQAPTPRQNTAQALPPSFTASSLGSQGRKVHSELHIKFFRVQQRDESSFGYCVLWTCNSAALLCPRAASQLPQNLGVLGGLVLVLNPRRFLALMNSVRFEHNIQPNSRTAATSNK